MIEVLHPGLLTTVQDRGRSGFEVYGLPPSGAFDPFLSAIANKLAGNSPQAALFEFAMVGPNLRFQNSCAIAICGFGVEYDLNGERAETFRYQSIPAGSDLKFITMKGSYGYIAAAGGILTQKVLGSAATYVSGNIGRRLMKGDVLQFGEPTGLKFALRENYRSLPKDSVVHLLPAQHTSLFHAREQQRISENSYKISVQSNRMGIRLEGVSIVAPVLRRSVPALPGVLQVPRSGLPILLGPEGPTTGGYPQLAMISRVSWTVLAGARPGELIRFQWIDPEDARQMWKYRSRLFDAPEVWEPL